MNYTYPENGASLVIDEAKCTGCGQCVNVCPHAVFEITNRIAHIVRRGSCMECGACALNCSAGAITVSRGVGCAAAILNRYRGKTGECNCDSTLNCC